MKRGFFTKSRSISVILIILVIIILLSLSIFINKKPNNNHEAVNGKIISYNNNSSLIATLKIDNIISDSTMFPEAPFALHATSGKSEYIKDLDAEYIRMIFPSYTADTKEEQINEVKKWDNFLINKRSDFDVVFTFVSNNNIRPEGVHDFSFALLTEEELQTWVMFIGSFIERYDGDDDYGCRLEKPDCYNNGDNLFPSEDFKDKISKRPLKYVQVENEWLWQIKDPSNFSELAPKEELLHQFLTIRNVIKDKSPDIKIVLGGITAAEWNAFYEGYFEEDYIETGDDCHYKKVYRKDILDKHVKMIEDAKDRLNYMLKEASPYYDIIDIHHYGIPGDDSDISDLESKLKWLNDDLESLGITGKETWCMECTDPFYFFPIMGLDTPDCSQNIYDEKIHSSQLIKLYMVGFENGLKKIFYSSLMPTFGWSDNYLRLSLIDAQPQKLSLIYPPEEKPAYYTYKLMIQKLEKATKLERFRDENVRIYKFSFSYKDPVYVIWSDTGDNIIDLSSIIKTENVKVTHIVTEPEKTDSEAIIETVSTRSLAISETPIFVEEIKDDNKEFCGDNVCDIGEDCLTCSVDCGKCDNSYIEQFGLGSISTKPELLTDTGVELSRHLMVDWVRMHTKRKNNDNTLNFTIKPYDWTYLDNEIKRDISANLKTKLTLHSASPVASQQDKIDEFMSTGGFAKPPLNPEYYDEWCEFVTAMVERYDGDGIDDMPNLKYPVRIYEYGMEYGPYMVWWTGTTEEYMRESEIFTRCSRKAYSDIIIVANGIANVKEHRIFVDENYKYNVSKATSHFLNEIDSSSKLNIIDYSKKYGCALYVFEQSLMDLDITIEQFEEYLMENNLKLEDVGGPELNSFLSNYSYTINDLNIDALDAARCTAEHKKENYDFIYTVRSRPDLFDVDDARFYLDFELEPDRISKDIEFLKGLHKHFGYQRPIITTEGSGNYLYRGDVPEGGYSYEEVDKILNVLITDIDRNNELVKDYEKGSAIELVKLYASLFGNDIKAFYYYPAFDHSLYWNKGIVADTHYIVAGLLKVDSNYNELYKKPAYYAYSLTAEKLKGYEESSKILEGSDIYAYKFNVDNKNIIVIWRSKGESNFDLSSYVSSENVKISHIVTELDSSFNPIILSDETMSASSVPISEIPIFVEEIVEESKNSSKLICKDIIKKLSFDGCEDCPVGYELTECKNYGFFSQKTCEKVFETKCMDNPRCIDSIEIDRKDCQL